MERRHWSSDTAACRAWYRRRPRRRTTSPRRSGRDALEEDLHLTKDCVLVARHNPWLSDNTNIAEVAKTNAAVARPQAHRARARVKAPRRPPAAGRHTSTDLTDPADPKSVLKSLIVDGEDHTDDWSITDFTMAELKQWIGGTTYDAANERPKEFNGKFPIISFQDIIDIAKAKSQETGRSIPVYPETKNPTWNNAQAIANGCGAAGSRPLEDALIKIIEDNGLNTKDAPIFVQSFEPGSLKYMRSHGLETRHGPARRRQRHRLQDRQGSTSTTSPTRVRIDWTVAGDARAVRCDADARGPRRDQDLCRRHRPVEGRRSCR